MKSRILPRSMTRVACVLTSLVWSLISLTPIHASDLTNWRVVQIPGAANVEAAAINAAGSVAGTYTTPTSEHGFIRNPNGTITSFDVFANAGVQVYGMNDHGQVAGVSGESGFIRNPDGSIVTVTYPASDSTYVYGINNLGQVIGVAFGSPGAEFIRSPDGTFTKLTFPEISAVPVSLNDSGAIVGFYYSPTMTSGFLLGTDGSFTTIDVPGGFGAAATGINNLGQVVGFYTVHPPQYPDQDQNRGFVRDIDGTITTFDAPYLGSTMPSGISDKGTIAASFSRNQSNFAPNMGLFRSCILCP